ncbi:MAG: hypothetical protein ISQ34_00105 [Rickettsiales bacterium]|nr:hypothetical protein [Rickettsiales bacterium]
MLSMTLGFIAIYLRWPINIKSNFIGMKSLFNFLFILFTLFSFNVSAESAVSYKIIRDENNPRDEKIKKLDFDDVFKQAQQYRRESMSWKKLKCTPRTGFLCAKWSCKKKDVSSYLILDKDSKQITRCSEEDCESISAKFEPAGIYYNIHAEGPLGSLIRILGNSRYKEITTVGLDAYIGNGECEEIE